MASLIDSLRQVMAVDGVRSAALVDIATIGLIQVDMGRHPNVLLEQLEAALDLRIAIEQAKGILAEALEINPAAAFAVMRRHAAERGRRLTDLAHALIERDPSAADLLTRH